MRKVLLQLIFISSLSFLVLSCEKGDEQFPPFVSGETTLVRLPSAGSLVTLALDITAGFETIDVLEIQRTPPSQADLQKTLVVKVKRSPTALSDLGARAVLEMPETVYRHNAANPFDGQSWTVTFQPGETIAYLKLDINTSALASFGRVGMGFQLVEAQGARISSTMNQAAVEIGAKNQYDGVYRVRYRLFHPTNTAITGNGVIPEWDFPSSGPTSIDWDTYTVFINFSTGGLTYFGDALGPSLQVRMIVNPADNTVAIQNIGSRAIPLAFPPLVVPPGVTNRYDPASKTFYVAYTWTTGGAGTTREKYDTLIYLRPR